MTAWPGPSSRRRDFASGRAWCGARPKPGLSSVLLGRCGLGSRIEWHIVLEHAEHDHGELARQRHLGLVGAGAPGDPHGPALELRANSSASSCSPAAIPAAAAFAENLMPVVRHSHRVLQLNEAAARMFERG